jgi:hypothetical protein
MILIFKLRFQQHCVQFTISYALHDAEEESLPGTGDGPRHHNYDDGFDEVDPMVEMDADARRDEIAQAMWEDYQQICAERDAQRDSDETTDEAGEEETDEEEETDNDL